jgi:TPR repeat protein
MLGDLDPFLPSLQNTQVFLASVLLLLALLCLSLASLWQHRTGQGPHLTTPKQLAAVPTTLLFGGWLVIGAGMLAFAGAMGGSLTIVLLASLLGLSLLAGLFTVLVAWVRSKVWADWALIILVTGTILPVITMQRLWICEPLAWSGVQLAQVCTARLYASGVQGAIRNVNIAADWYGQAANNGSEEATFALLQVTRNKHTQRRLLTDAAEAGNDSAVYQLYLLLGPVEGRVWLDRAIAAQHPDALHQQSLHLRTGEYGFPMDTDQALDLLFRAAELGSMAASAELALGYERGDRSFGYSRSESRYWERQVKDYWPGTARFRTELSRYRTLRDDAAAGVATAMMELAADFDQRARQDVHYQADATLWLSRAADSGAADAQFDMAFRVFQDQNASSEDLAKARAWLTAAAEQDHRYALSNLSHYLTNGQHGFEIDLDRALTYGTRHEAVLQQENARSTDIARARGRLTRIQQVRSEEDSWTKDLGNLTERAAAGEADAKFELYEKHDQDRQRGDRVLAQKLLQEAAELGHLEARYRIASRTFQQSRTPAQEERAYVWMADLAERGHRGALVFMGHLYARGSSKRDIAADPDRARAYYQQALTGLEGDVVYERKNGTMTVSTRRQQVEEALARLSS